MSRKNISPMEFDEWLKVPERGNIPHVMLRIGADILLQDLPCHRFPKASKRALCDT